MRVDKGLPAATETRLVPAVNKFHDRIVFYESGWGNKSQTLGVKANRFRVSLFH
jgi:hypothetical protein